MHDDAASAAADHTYYATTASKRLMSPSRPRPDPAERRLAALDTASKIAAPVTVLTALLVYIGWTRTNAYFGYFGVDSSLLSLSVQDYMLRSVASSFVAVTRFVTFALILVALDLGFKRLMTVATGPFANIRLRQALALLGVVLAAIGLCVAIIPEVAVIAGPYIGAASLVIGAVVLLRFGPSLAPAHNGREIALPGRVTGLAAAVCLIAAFWAVTLYAQDLGVAAAKNADGSPELLSDASVLSDKPLDIPGDQVIVTRNALLGDQTGYRYSGLRVLAYSSGRWFMITGRRPGERSTVIVLRDLDTLRVEVAATS